MFERLKLARDRVGSRPRGDAEKNGCAPRNRGEGRRRRSRRARLRRDARRTTNVAHGGDPQRREHRRLAPRRVAHGVARPSLRLGRACAEAGHLAAGINIPARASGGTAKASRPRARRSTDPPQSHARVLRRRRPDRVPVSLGRACAEAGRLGAGINIPARASGGTAKASRPRAWLRLGRVCAEAGRLGAGVNTPARASGGTAKASRPRAWLRLGRVCAEAGRLGAGVNTPARASGGTAKASRPRARRSTKPPQSQPRTK